MIKIKNLTKKYNDLIAVNNITLSIDENQIFALLGLNGAGKTTLIKMLSCLTSPTSGDAFIFEKSILTHSALIKKSINISPQETSVAQNLTVLENLIFVAQVYGFNKKQAIEKSKQLIKLFELNDKTNTLSKKLSGGQQRKLGIAMALISEPKILFLDEPTLGLDIISRRNLWEIIKKIKEKTLVVLTTHYLDEVEHLADKVAIMKDGKVIESDTVKNIISKTGQMNFEEAFVWLSQKEQ